MLRRSVAILLIFCTLAANFSRLFVFAGFQLNQNYIASTLCVNRDKPWLHCNGRCYLMKKIQQAEQKEKAAEQQTQKNLFQEAFWSTTNQVTFPSQLLQVIDSPYNNTSTRQIAIKLLRPPQLG